MRGSEIADSQASAKALVEFGEGMLEAGRAQLLTQLAEIGVNLRGVTVSRDSVTRGGLCLACGEYFTATRRDAKYCSSPCRQRTHRQRRSN